MVDKFIFHKRIFEPGRNHSQSYGPLSSMRAEIISVDNIVCADDTKIGKQN